MSAEETLPRTVGWPAAALLAAGTVLPVTSALGPMAAELGPSLIAVWLAVAVVGALQCGLLTELAARFPDQAGGSATYAHRTLPRCPTALRAVSGWGYWLAWTPGIAVNLVLAAGYLRAGLGIDAPLMLIVAAFGAAVYGLVALGLRPGVRGAALLAAAVVVPLAGLLAGALATPGAFSIARLGPLTPAAEDWQLVVKWLFVAAWAGYGAEMASTVVAEMRTAQDAPKALALSAVVGVAGFGLLPALLLGLAGSAGISDDPLVALLPAAEAAYGSSGRAVVAVMLAAALLLGAVVFAIGSSRTVFQMSRDELLPNRLAALNRRGAPIGSIALDTGVIVLLLALFGSDIVSIVAAANVGYLVVFTLMPIGFIAARRRDLGDRGGFRLGRAWTATAAAAALGNAALLIVGGAQWGAQWGARVMLVGSLLLLLAVPLSRVGRHRRPARA